MAKKNNTVTALRISAYLRWGSVAASFFAENAPCLQVSDGVFHGDADFGELRVKFGLIVMKFGALALADWREVDALDAEVAEVRHGVDIRERVGQPGGAVGVSVVAGTVNWRALLR